MLLNDKTIKALAPGKLHTFAGVKAQGTTAPSGFCIKVTPAGCISFMLRYYPAGKDRLLTIGQYPDWSITNAIKEARKLRQRVDRGEDPLGARQKEEQAGDTFKRICEECLEQQAKRLRSLEAQRRTLERLVYPELGARQIADIKRSDVARLLNKIASENGETMADRTLAVIRKVMNWYSVQADDYRSPIVRGMARTSAKERARDRVLNDDELRAVWDTAEAPSSGTMGRLVRFILLTGARREEACGLTPAEIRDGVWTLPPERNKVKEALTRPLSALAQTLLDKPGLSNFLFSTDGGATAFSCSPHSMDTFREACGVAEHWTLHDLRRTARSLMPRAGVTPDIAERCLGHVISGVRGVYDRYEYLDEKRQAYEALAGLIERIVNPQANVVALRA
jgi:integrase